MMGLSQTTGYAIYALACLEDPACRPRLIRDIAACSAIPKAYLAKVVNQLSRKGLLATKRGYRGGIFLTKPASTISLLEIVLAVEGDRWIGDCMLGLQGCEASDRCPTHAEWQHIRTEIETVLRHTMLSDVIHCLRQPRREKPGDTRSCPCGKRA
jgi:Rrf2 family transcriptional regulator, iron-sulfur cluster assembly transcription factor